MRNLQYRKVIFATAILLITALSGCACRPGYVGPYGGLHAGRCWVW